MKTLALVCILGVSALAQSETVDVYDKTGPDAQWFQIRPSTGGVNFLWRWSGSGQQARQFYFWNGRSSLVMYGPLRDGQEYGSGIGLFTDDLQNEVLVGSGSPEDNQAGGVHLKAQSFDFNFHFRATGLTLPGNPVYPKEATTKEYVDREIKRACTFKGVVQ